MPDSNLVQLTKRAAVEAVEATKPVQILFGQVTSASPLKIQIDQKAILTEKMLVLARNVTDYEVDITVSHWGELESEHTHPVTTGGTATAVSHRHQYKGMKKFKVHNALIVGDWVVLARVQKGKQYVVLDRIKAIPELKGEWV